MQSLKDQVYTKEKRKVSKYLLIGILKIVFYFWLKLGFSINVSVFYYTRQSMLILNWIWFIVWQH